MQWGKLVDVIVARTGFDVDIGSVEAAFIPPPMSKVPPPPLVAIPLSTDLTFHHPISQQGVRGTEPHRSLGSTPVHIYTRLWHLDTGALQEHTIPSLPIKPIITVIGKSVSC